MTPGGAGGCLGLWPAPADPPPHRHQKKFPLTKKMEIYKRGRKFEAVFSTQTFFWPLTPPLPGGGGGCPLSNGLALRPWPTATARPALEEKGGHRAVRQTPVKPVDDPALRCSAWQCRKKSFLVMRQCCATRVCRSANAMSAHSSAAGSAAFSVRKMPRSTLTACSPRHGCWGWTYNTRKGRPQGSAANAAETGGRRLGKGLGSSRQRLQLQPPSEAGRMRSKQRGRPVQILDPNRVRKRLGIGGGGG